MIRWMVHQGCHTIKKILAVSQHVRHVGVSSLQCLAGVSLPLSFWTPPPLSFLACLSSLLLSFGELLLIEFTQVRTMPYLFWVLQRWYH